MKKLFQLLSLFSVIELAINFSSCKKEGCTDTAATNFESAAKKDDGTCRYDPAVFSGTYNMRDTTTDLIGVVITQDYELTIVYGGIVNEIELQSLSNSGENFKATIRGNNFTIPPQGTVTQGEGLVTGNKIRIAFSYNNFTCVGTGVKQ